LVRGDARFETGITFSFAIFSYAAWLIGRRILLVGVSSPGKEISHAHLAVISGEYGQRNVSNIRQHRPSKWKVEVWQPPAELPLIIDAPRVFVPATLPPTDLLLSFGEQRAIAELLPEVVRVTGAHAVIAPVNNEAWLPGGMFPAISSKTTFMCRAGHS
jgi:hypothetical protein